MDTVIVITADSPQESDLVQPLRDSGWRVLVRRYDHPMEAIATERPDALIVDVPDARRVTHTVAPFMECLELKETAKLVVVGDAGLPETSRVEGLDDFILRPLRPPELVQRVQRSLRARGRGVDERLRMGTLVIDMKGYEATVAGSRLDLTYQEFELLKFLASNPRQAFTRDQLLARVWGYDYYGGSRTVDIHVRRIRAKLGHPYAACLKTIRHVGYKWVNDNE